MSERAGGVLLHISSLPGQYGIGDFGKWAYEFVDFLHKAKLKYWQVLPLGLTGYGNSPYSSFSAFAGNPYYVDLDELIKEGYLSKEEVEEVGFTQGNFIEYKSLYRGKINLLRQAYSRSKGDLKEVLDAFYEEHAQWLGDFSLYMSLKEVHKYKSWQEWEGNYKDYHSSEIEEFKVKNHQEENFWVFTQYYFHKQWFALKDYANNRGVKIIGDLPIYVANDSVDVWANPSLFHLNENLVPVTLSGTPPDAFSPTGQLWGNPTYRWDEMEKMGYDWWIRRIEQSFTLFDSVRIDHFRGFASYWEVPYGAENAIEGQWVKGPGMKLFKKIKDELGQVDIIAEDLGVITREVKDLLQETGYPGMRVLQFAFDPSEDSDHLPHNYTRDCVAYTGTHDNSPVNGWLQQTYTGEREFAKKYLNHSGDEETHWALIRAAWSSTAYLSIAQMQDFLGLGEEARMNTPSTTDNNWVWRMSREDMSQDLAERIADLTTLYRRD